MIAAADAQFLRRLVNELQKKRMTVYRPGRRRSAAALILRFGESGIEDAPIDVSKLFSRLDKNMSPDEVVRRLEANVDGARLERASDLRLLLVKRSSLSSDRWSGQIALPGGGRDTDDADDFSTLRRETYEELGIPLDSPDFVQLGQLENYKVRSRLLQHYDELDGAVQARFVFLHIGSLTPSVKLARHEIEAVRWCPLTTLMDRRSVEPARVAHHALHFVPMFSTDMGSMVRDLFPATFLRFPSIAVEPHLPNWRIWGLPLRTVSELVELDGKAPLDWPRFSSNSFLVQHLVVDAVHGWMMLTNKHFAGQRMRESHLMLAIIMDVAIVYLLAFTIASFLHTILLAILVACDYIGTDTIEQRRLTYWESHPPLISSTLPYGDATSRSDNKVNPHVEAKLREKELLASLQHSSETDQQETGPQQPAELPSVIVAPESIDAHASLGQASIGAPTDAATLAGPCSDLGPESMLELPEAVEASDTLEDVLARYQGAATDKS